MTYSGFDLTGSVAVVIGGTSGLGRVIAYGLADAGADVVATGRRANLVEDVAGQIEERGRRTLRQVSDVTDATSLRALCDSVVGALGRVDILVNSAGRTRRTPTLEVSEREWSEILDTNLNGTLRSCQVFGREMIQRGYGRIVNIASLSSLVALYETAAYAASKAAVAALTKNLAVEWARHGVCVNAIVPGVFRTELNAALLDGTERGREFLTRTPMHRFGQLDEIVGSAVFLSSKAASFVTGHLLAVDGGFLASGVNQ